MDATLSSSITSVLAAIAEARSAIAGGGGRAVALPMASSLIRLGALYRHAGQPMQAYACIDESLALRLRYLGEDHVDTLDRKAGVADLLRWQGRLIEAEFLETCIVDARVRLQGAGHADTLAARASLATTLACQGQLPQLLFPPGEWQHAASPSRDAAAERPQPP